MPWRGNVDPLPSDEPAEGIALNILNNGWRAHQMAHEYARGERMEVTDIAFVTVLGEKYLRRLFVIVEMYERKNFGRGRRRFRSEFTEQERKTLSRWHARIHAWYLVTGVPREGVRMSTGTYETLCKFADFFASLT